MRDDLKKKKAGLAPILSLVKAALSELASHNGTHWKEARGELHSQYNEIPIWVLLYEDSDLVQTHKALCETLRPHMEGLAPLQIWLCYEVVVGDRASAAILRGNDAVFSFGTNGKMELRWVAQQPDGISTVFKSHDSKR